MRKLLIRFGLVGPRIVFDTAGDPDGHPRGVLLQRQRAIACASQGRDQGTRHSGAVPQRSLRRVQGDRWEVRVRRTAVRQHSQQTCDVGERVACGPQRRRPRLQSDRLFFRYLQGEQAGPQQFGDVATAVGKSDLRPTLSTLRPTPRSVTRMARGRCGSLYRSS
jgi:hypothetical protein